MNKNWRVKKIHVDCQGICCQPSSNNAEDRQYFFSSQIRTRSAILMVQISRAFAFDVPKHHLLICLNKWHLLFYSVKNFSTIFLSKQHPESKIPVFHSFLIISTIMAFFMCSMLTDLLTYLCNLLKERVLGAIYCIVVNARFKQITKKALREFFFVGGCVIPSPVPFQIHKITKELWVNMNFETKQVSSTMRCSCWDNLHCLPKNVLYWLDFQSLNSLNL